MSNDIDWSKAPEDATHFSPTHKAFVALWAKIVDGVYLYKPMDNSRDWYYGAQPSNGEKYIPRPSSQAWNGSGLPPVGTVCEASVSGMGSWFECLVLIHHPAESGVAVVHDVIGHALLWTDTLRLIRTPEQIAAEEREAAVAAMLELDPYLPNTALGMMSRTDFCRTLYDAGYRKVEQPK